MTRKIIFMALLLLSASPSWGQSANDRIQRKNGIDTGLVTATTPLEVTISKGRVTSKIPAEDIESIQFDGEPSELNSARIQFSRGKFDTALERLKPITPADINRDEVRQEYDFLNAASHAEMALAGKGDLKAAITEIGAFLTTHRASYHVPAAIELHGDLYQADGDMALARKKYETLAKAPSPYFKARSALLVAKLLQEQGEHEEAISQFDSVLTAAGTNTLADGMKREALLGRAVSQAATGKTTEATEAISNLIRQTETDDTEGLAQGYNALGDCLAAGNDSKGARNAYLHVDLLYPNASDEHAKALFRLTNLWKDMRQPTRAQEAQQRLTDDYPLSRWTRR